MKIAIGCDHGGYDLKMQVIEHLKELDAFSYRRAVPYVAAQLGVSRYTIYKYLDEVKDRPKKEEA